MYKRFLALTASVLLCLTACSAAQEAVVQDSPTLSLTGIAEEDLKSIKFGEQFHVHSLMDQDGTMVGNVDNGGIKLTAVWSNGRIVATYHASYNSNTGQVIHGTFGQRYVEELNEVLSSTELDLSRGVVFGIGQNRAFATDGIYILMWPAVGPEDMFIDDPLSDEEMQALCGTIWENATDRFYGIDPAK